MLKIETNLKRKHEDIEKIIDLPLEVLVNEFDEKAVKSFGEDFQKAVNTGQPIVPVTISSYGGEVYYLLAMIDVILSSPVPVATIVKGAAMSCGGILAAFGNIGRRYATPNSTYMLHDVSSFSRGKVSEMKSDAKEIERLNNKIFHMLAKHTGKPKDYYLSKIHDLGHGEWYMDPYEAATNSLCDHVKVPRFTAEIKYNLRFE